MNEQTVAQRDQTLDEVLNIAAPLEAEIDSLENKIRATGGNPPTCPKSKFTWEGRDSYLADLNAHVAKLRGIAGNLPDSKTPQEQAGIEIAALRTQLATITAERDAAQAELAAFKDSFESNVAAQVCKLGIKQPCSATLDQRGKPSNWTERVKAALAARK